MESRVRTSNHFDFEADGAMKNGGSLGLMKRFFFFFFEPFFFLQIHPHLTSINYALYFN